MGLYGALIVRPTLGAGYAYDASTQFDPSREYLLLLSDIDPALHHAVETGGTYDFNALRSRYFAINGREFPDTLQDNGTALLPNQPYGSLVRIEPNASPSSPPALIRMINAGVLNHPFHPHGNHTREVAQDGRLLASTEHFGETIASGQTQDYLLRWDDQDHWAPNPPPGQQLPVPQPNYRNLMFKDGNTFYSGNPYLGYKGTLPTGTVQQNVCGEWYFPLHSHALNEFANFDEAFGGMATLLRVDPPGGCFGWPTLTSIVGGTLKSGTFAALGLDDGTYYQVNPKTTTRPTATTAGQPTITVASAAGFPTSGNLLRPDRQRGPAGHRRAGHDHLDRGPRPARHRRRGPRQSGRPSRRWPPTGTRGSAAFRPARTNLKVTYKGENCGSTTLATCAPLTSNLPQQTVKICDWTVAGAAGCSTSTSAGWVTLPPPPAQPQGVGSSDVNSTWTLPGSANAYIGTGTYKGQVRVLVHTQRWTAPSPTAFSTWGNHMKIVYDAP